MATPSHKHPNTGDPAPKYANFLIEDGSDPRIPKREPDAYVEMGRDIAGHLLRHPERYQRKVMGDVVLVVDDSSYEALFYLFAGKTRDRMYTEDEKVCALYCNQHFILSEKLFNEARYMERGD